MILFLIFVAAVVVAGAVFWASSRPVEGCTHLTVGMHVFDEYSPPVFVCELCGVALTQDGDLDG